MSFIDRLLDLLPARRLRPERWPRVFVGNSPALDDEFELALFTLSSVPVQAVYAELGIDSSALARKVASRDGHPGLPSRESLRHILAEVQAWREDRLQRGLDSPALACHLHLALFTLGGPGIKAALSTPALPAGAFAFRVACGTTEARWTADWPADGPHARHIEVLNDDHSPVEKVIACLEQGFGLSRADAVDATLKIHVSGDWSVEWPGAQSPAEACLVLNRLWRASGLPLRCRPAAWTSAPGTSPALPAS